MPSKKASNLEFRQTAFDLVSRQDAAELALVLGEPANKAPRWPPVAVGTVNVVNTVYSRGLIIWKHWSVAMRSYTLLKSLEFSMKEY